MFLRPNSARSIGFRRLNCQQLSVRVEKCGRINPLELRELFGLLDDFGPDFEIVPLKRARGAIATSGKCAN
jgi:hypothetical protein